MHPKQKLYVVVRRDLAPGAQAVQAGHALTEFAIHHPETFKQWYSESNHLCYLSVADEQALRKLCFKATQRDITFAAFVEPDMDDQLTAVSFEPTVQTAKLMSGLPLASLAQR